MARVMVLFGGRSAEHEVSCVSAVAVVAALEGAGHEVIPVGIDRNGAWWLADRPDPQAVLEASGTPATFRLPGGTLETAGTVHGFDIVFPVLHGPFGEDGTIQGVFEIAGIPYVGCRVTSSAVAMDKDLTKRIIVGAGIPTVPWRTIHRAGFDDPSAVARDLIDELGLPLFVKPAELGSSVGVTMCATEAELKDGILEAFAHGPKVIVEEAIAGREIEVAVLDGPRASVPGEILVTSGWYDYDAKYADATSRFIAPADLDEMRTAEVQELARRAFTALGCRGLARVDFFLEDEGRVPVGDGGGSGGEGRGFLLNEVNTMPGFTPISGFPKMWMASGMTYPELCSELVDLALPG